MAEFMDGLKRDIYCAEVTEKMIGKQITVTGWAAKRRDFGGLIFIDLRDRSGLLQIVFDASKSGADFAKAENIRSEYVLAVKGVLRSRSPDTVNPKLKTGSVELLGTTLKILAESDTPPFALDDSASVNEAVKLKYRYLDLRTPYLQERVAVRHNVTKAARDYLSDEGFLEIETPFLGKSTPEGARDYLVPSRVHEGSFYALPQSPQLYKQILMISGFDRYYQIARCFRDEDLRANRQPEFTQIDLEMSFVEDESDVMSVAEGLIAKIYKAVKGESVPKKIRRFTYAEAMNRFGSDKPDTRFGLELCDISDIATSCGFQVFEGAVKNGGSVRLINAKGFGKSDNPILSRRDIDALTDFVRTYRAKGLAWIAMKDDGVQSVITKFMTPQTVDAILKRANAETGDVLFFCADKNDVVFASLGALRLHLGELGGLIDRDKTDMLWVTDFPLFEYSQEEKRFVAVHHPFTAPKNEDIPLLESGELAPVRSKAYDFVINGQEAGGGSIRIHSRGLQKKVFNALGFSDKQVEERFGFFINAFNYGAPPHGGLAFGLDRLVMLLTDTDNIKDVIAFPKVQNASDLMTQAPAPVDEKQLRELRIKTGERGT
ncbi:MAG: aspartate--tRNA ligase [Clostridiales bacterium]|jgi:aspartyl-tRNA synthetase|nr:aspartate--tRNA ligase [Clostridiales bacterium]